MDLDEESGAPWALERRRSGDDAPEIVRDRLDWRPDATLPPLEIILPAPFHEVLGSG